MPTNKTAPRRLYRSDSNKVFGGVCGGIGDYLGVDPVVVRLITLLIIIFTGFFPGLIAYIFAVVIIPKKPKKMSGITEH